MSVSRLSVGTLLFSLSFALLLAIRLADADVPPAGYGQPNGEFDITLSRVPVSDRATAKALKPPFQPTPEILAEGKAIFLGKGTCFQCHGPGGKGDGGRSELLPIQPRHMTTHKVNQVGADG